MTLWHKGHGRFVFGRNFSRAAVSPQIFPIYDKAETLHTHGARGAAVAPSEGFESRRGQHGI
jgi:hypothetical protein